MVMWSSSGDVGVVMEDISLIWVWKLSNHAVCHENLINPFHGVSLTNHVL